MELKVSKEITCKCILGDPGADIGAGESLNGRENMARRKVNFSSYHIFPPV